MRSSRTSDIARLRAGQMIRMWLEGGRCKGICPGRIRVLQVEKGGWQLEEWNALELN